VFPLRIPIPKHSRLFKIKKLNKDLSKTVGYNGIDGMAVCMGWRETEVSLTKLDQDRDKEK